MSNKNKKPEYAIPEDRPTPPCIYIEKRSNDNFDICLHATLPENTISITVIKKSSSGKLSLKKVLNDKEIISKIHKLLENTIHDHVNRFINDLMEGLDIKKSNMTIKEEESNYSFDIYDAEKWNNSRRGGLALVISNKN
jgi:hypothetical protein